MVRNLAQEYDRTMVALDDVRDLLTRHDPIDSARDFAQAVDQTVRANAGWNWAQLVAMLRYVLDPDPVRWSVSHGTLAEPVSTRRGRGLRPLCGRLTRLYTESYALRCPSSARAQRRSSRPYLKDSRHSSDRYCRSIFLA